MNVLDFHLCFSFDFNLDLISFWVFLPLFSLQGCWFDFFHSSSSLFEFCPSAFPLLHLIFHLLHILSILLSFAACVLPVFGDVWPVFPVLRWEENWSVTLVFVLWCELFILPYFAASVSFFHFLFSFPPLLYGSSFQSGTFEKEIKKKFAVLKNKL